MKELSKPSDPAKSKKIRREIFKCIGVALGGAVIVLSITLFVAGKIHERKQAEMINEFLQSMKK